MKIVIVLLLVAVASAGDWHWYSDAYVSIRQCSNGYSSNCGVPQIPFSCGDISGYYQPVLPTIDYCNNQSMYNYQFAVKISTIEKGYIMQINNETNRNYILLNESLVAIMSEKRAQTSYPGNYCGNTNYPGWDCDDIYTYFPNNTGEYLYEFPIPSYYISNGRECSNEPSYVYFAIMGNITYELNRCEKVEIILPSYKFSYYTRCLYE